MTKNTSQYRMTLHRLLADFAFLNDVADCEITGLATDSRKVKSGDLFIALRSVQTGRHGADFIKHAFEAGAAAVAVDIASGEKFDSGVLVKAYQKPVIGIENLDWKIGPIASRFYADPTSQLKMIGITGTNGKTSSTQFIAQCLHSDKTPCGLIGTLGTGIWGRLQTSHYTTPPAMELQQLLADVRDHHAPYAVMEVSSHGLHQGRVAGVKFHIAVLTNLTHDHLDYHGDMESYAKAKMQLFLMAGLKHAVINVDDAFGFQVLEQLPASVSAVTYSLVDANGPQRANHHVYGKIESMDMNGIRLSIRTTWGNGELQCGLLGAFNASNVLAVVSSLLALGFNVPEALSRVSQITPPPGRMERFGGTDRLPLVVVDYAHTPDALEKVLTTLRSHCKNALWVVFGCGGDRDRAKRPRMGGIAERLANHVVITDDNPRTEDARQIVNDILQGIAEDGRVHIDHDRANAIRYAVTSAGPRDVVLIAGKGHEDYQIVGNERRFFSDQQVVKKLFKEAA